MKKLERALLYKGFHMHKRGDKYIVVDGERVSGFWVIGYLNLTSGLAFITPYNLDATYNPEASTLLSPSVPVVKDTVCMFTGLEDCQEKSKLICQDDIVEYNDGIHYFKGKVVYACGAFGIGTDDTIPLDYSDSCRNDNFISFWELMEHQEVVEDNVVDYVTVICNVWEVEE